MGYRIVRLDRTVFEQWFVEGFTLPTSDDLRIRVTKGLPEGARLDAISDQVFFNTHEIALRFYHPDWPEEPGVAIPEARVEITLEATATFYRWRLDHITPAEKQELMQQLANDGA